MSGRREGHAWGHVRRCPLLHGSRGDRRGDHAKAQARTPTPQGRVHAYAAVQTTEDAIAATRLTTTCFESNARRVAPPHAAAPSVVRRAPPDGIAHYFF